MQPKVLTFLALLAPLPAVAFGDMDCIAIESCGNGGCGPTTELFSVTFNWGADSVTVEADGTAHDLPWVSSGDSTNMLGTEIEYGDLNDTNHLLRIIASGTDITAYYTFRTPLVTTWRATCDVRQAA